MIRLCHLIISLIVAFLLSLFFEGTTSKLVLVLCGSMFFCTLHLATMIVNAAEILGDNDRKIFNAVK